jgi:hypothetical protein
MTSVVTPAKPTAEHARTYHAVTWAWYGAGSDSGDEPGARQGQKQQGTEGDG